MKYALITGLFISSVFAEVNTTQIKVDGMQCSYSCAGKVNSVVQKIEGVKESSVDFAKGIATVTYDDKKVNRNDIIKNLKSNTGYSIEQASATTKEYGSCSGSKKKKKTKI
tara:strand:+ start:1030 stop:1362 length:333 start_codon:yes stop_codon:yes gene_type:complete